MDNGINVFGYSKKVKRQGAYLRKCVLTAVLWGAVLAANVVGALYLRSAAAFVFAAFAEAVLVLLTLPVFKLEYDYEMEDGTLTVAKINGGSRRREVCSVLLRKAILIAPLSDDVLRRCENERPARTVDVRCGFEPENEAVILFPDEKGRLTLLCFDANDRFFKAARFFAPSAARR